MKDEVKYYELTAKMDKHANPLSLLYMWVKSGHINQKEFIVLTKYWSELER